MKMARFINKNYALGLHYFGAQGRLIHENSRDDRNIMSLCHLSLTHIGLTTRKISYFSPTKSSKKKCEGQL